MIKIDKEKIISCTISGIIGLIFGIIAVALVHLAGIPFSNFEQTLIAVAIASFFGAFFGRFFALKT